MPYVYQWPESEPFISSYACRFLPRTGAAKFSNTVLGPVFNLVDISKPFVLFFSWIILIFSFILIYYVFPISFINSTDGQYVSVGRSLIFAVVVYFILNFILISSLQTRGCQELEAKASAYLYDGAPPIPPTLQDSAENIYEDIRKALRQKKQLNMMSMSN